LQIKDLFHPSRWFHTSFFLRWQSAGSISFRLAPYWIGGAITALVSVIFSKLFSLSEGVAFHWAGDHPWLAWVITPCGLLASWLIVQFLAPTSGGSGIPQLIAVLKGLPEGGKIGNRLLGAAVIPVKIISGCLSAAAGGVVGREGPMIHVAGAIFHGIYRIWPKRMDFGRKLDQGSMVLAGGAAGLAAAFNTPLGGIVFAIEELAKVHLSQARTYIFHSVVIAGLLSQAVLGNYLYLGRIHTNRVDFGLLIRVVPISILIGLLGGIFSSGLYFLMSYRDKLPMRKKALLTLGCGLVMAFLFFCLGPDVLGSGRENILSLLKNPHMDHLWALGFARGLGNFFTYAAGVAGGVFSPALATGATLGAWMAEVFPQFDPQLFVLVGMVAFLTGLTQTPFTSCVLVLEMTDGHSVIFSLMAAAICAQGGSKLVDSHSFYERVSERWLEDLRGESKAAKPQ
jgi:H+/Cl- antiporter ClcA